MERWRPIAEFEGLYEVSDLGRVKSLARAETVVSPRAETFIRRRGERFLRQSIANGYRRVYLYRDGIGGHYLVHSLVIRAFVGERPDGMVVCHRDGSRDNNAATNLRYGTHKENTADMEIHGTMPRGATHANTRLSDADILTIRRTPNGYGVNQRLAREYGVSAGHISAVRRGVYRTSVSA